MAVSWSWRIEFHKDDSGSIHDIDETKDYAEAVRIGNQWRTRGDSYTYEVPLVRTVWNHNEGVTDEEYFYPPFQVYQLSTLPKKYVSQYDKEVRGW